MAAFNFDINRAYAKYLNSTHPIEIYYGSAGSGKSVFVAQKQLYKALTQPYYRLIFVRNYAENIRDSQFQLFKDLINNYNLEKYFTVKESTMDIICKNGNMMLSHGIDKPEKIKSITEPSDVWIEEMTEIKEESFIQLKLRLRTTKAKHLQMIGTFNPIDERHWIKKRLFDSTDPNVAIIKTTYKDNAFLDDEYRKTLEEMQRVNPNYYRIYTLGEWGRPETQRPYISNFNYQTHVSDTAVFRSHLPIHFSIDFNIEPFVLICGHIFYENNQEKIHIFKEIVLDKGDISEMVRKVRSTFTPYQLSVSRWTGDATGRSRTVVTKNNMSAWSLLVKELDITPKRLDVPKSNPAVADNRFFIEYLFANHSGLKINPDCKLLINEIEFTEADENGNIIKKDRNKDTQRADALDCLRYFLNTWKRNSYKELKQIA